MSTITHVEEKLRGHYCKHGSRKFTLIKLFWMVYKAYIYTPQRVLEEETWASFMEIFCELPFNVQALIIQNLHGNMKTWCIQHKSLIIDAFKLTKYRRWIPILVCLFILL
jgi:hypothetical protein